MATLASRSLPAPARHPAPRLPTSIRFSLSHQNQPSADQKRRRAPVPSHPAFSGGRRAKKIPVPDTGEPAEGVRVTDRGLAYLLDGAPFEFQYSYTEAPRARPVALREAPFLPFGPEATPRPWTGRKPLPKSRKEMPEFDSFVLPPPGKKGVKPVQSPGPFLAGMEPRYQAASREEVLGEPFTREEVAELVKGSLKTKRQLNMGRDGLTHNMLENIHALWKRKRVCKIKCKGVCTVDMDNICQQLEEKVGGKVIHRQGGVIFLFRGRNYNARTRPCFPLMLWKPAAPVYPRLVKTVPDGLTPDEATQMRQRGRQLTPVCKLAKNGVYVNLVKQVREAFEACDLARVDCSGLNKSDCRKIGAKLKDLVPCILLSFEFEHILMWRGNDWKSSLPSSDENKFEVASDQQLSSGKETLNDKVIDLGTALTPVEVIRNAALNPNIANDVTSSSASAAPEFSNSIGVAGTEPSVAAPLDKGGTGSGSSNEITELETTRVNNEDMKSDSTVSSYMQEVLLLVKQAIASGRALVLDESEFVDADVVYQKSVAFAKTAPRGPFFQHTVRKSVAKRNEPDKRVRVNKHLGETEVSGHVEKKDNSSRGPGMQRNDHAQDFLSDVVPQGTLRVDELAKLLA